MSAPIDHHPVDARRSKRPARFPALLIPALAIAVTLLATPALANAAPGQQWGPTFEGHYVTLAVGVGEMTTCTVESRLNDYIRAMNGSLRHGKQPASLRAGSWQVQSFDCSRWYALFVWAPGCSAPQWIAVQPHRDHLDVIVNGGRRSTIRAGATFCREIEVARSACEVHYISLHLKAICEHEFGYQATTRCETLHRHQPPHRPHVQPRPAPAPRPAPRVVIDPRRNVTRYHESRSDNDRRQTEGRHESRDDHNRGEAHGHDRRQDDRHGRSDQRHENDRRDRRDRRDPRSRR